MASEPVERTVLVVGGAGYVGSILVRRLLLDGYRVRVLDNLLWGHGSTTFELLDHPAYEFLRGDLADADDAARGLDGATDVVMLASLVGDPITKKYPEETHRVNSDGTIAFCDLMSGRGIGRFVFTSTCSNYGLRSDDTPATEESELAPLSLYAETKVAFERHLLDAAIDLDACPVVLRLATAYGLSPRMRFDLTISEFTRELAAGKELLVYDADTWRPYCHVVDISDAIVRALEAPRDVVEGEVFNVGSEGEHYTKRMIVETVLDALEGEGIVSYHEGGVDPRNYRVDFTKVSERLGFANQFTIAGSIPNLIEGVRAGAFDDVDERGSFYGNYEIPGAR